MKRAAAAFVPIDKPNEQRCLSEPPMKLVQDLERFRNKTRLEDQVLWRITGDRELGRNDEFRAGRGETLVRLKDLLEIAVQIPNGGIELCETDFHADSYA